jgi:hypothetical protein
MPSKMTKGWASVKKQTEEWANPPKASHLLKLFAEACYHRMFAAHGSDFTFIPATFAFAGSPEPGRLLLPRLLLLFLQSLRLLKVSLQQLFRLLLMPLLHLLLACLAGIVLRQPLMFLILLLLCCCWYFRSRFGSPVLAAAGRSNGGMPSGSVSGVASEGRVASVNRVRRWLICRTTVVKAAVGGPWHRFTEAVG